MLITKQGNKFLISFKYKPNLVDQVKGLPGRGWDPVNKCWSVPEVYEAHVRKFAQAHGFRFSEEIADEVIGVAPELPELQVNIPLKLNLFPYQAKGVAYALEKKKVIIGDQPGLGKTAQAIATITAANAFPCLVIAPSSLKINWQREWQMWTDKKAMILNDNVKQNFHLFWSSGLCDVFITNYESLKKYFVLSINKPTEKAKLRLDHIKFKTQMTDIFKSVIIDESHRVKSTGTQQTKFTKGIATGKEYILALTGTPVVNKPKDLISQLGIIEKLGRLGGYQKFVKRYCGGTNEASNLRELNYLLNLHCFYRRDKQEVLKDLPAKMRQVISCDITTRKEYAVAEANLVKYLMDYKNATDEQIERSLRGEIMVTIGILKNISARGKLNDVYEFIDDILESEEKLVIFAHLKEVIAAIKKQFPNAVTVTGDDSQASRQYAIDSFQNNPEKTLIICSIKAAGVGLTLTASSRVAFVELPWTAADCDQCEDRCHRIGQKDSVTASYFLGSDTIDEKIYQIIQRKRDIASTITGSQEQIEEDYVNLIADLFNQPQPIES